MQAVYIKKNSEFAQVETFYKKQNSFWHEITSAEFSTYITTENASIYENSLNLTRLEIGAPRTLTAETCQCNVSFNGVELTSGYQISIVSGNSYASMNSAGVLTILSVASASNVTLCAVYEDYSTIHNMVVTYKSGSTSQTTTQSVVDQSGNTTETTTTITENEDGTSTSEITVIKYNENGDPTEKTNESIDEGGNINKQEIEYDENGNELVIGYSIDTSDNPDGKKTYYGEGVNTEYYAFDATDGFEMAIHFTIDFSNRPSGQDENHHQIVSAKRATPSPWYGFQLRQSSTNKYIQLGVQFSTGSNVNTSIVSSNVSGNIGEYNIKITYDPTASTKTFVCTDLSNGQEVYSGNGIFPDIEDLKNLKLTIGCGLNENYEPYRFSKLEVMDFYLKKLSKSIMSPTISCDGLEVTITCGTQGAIIYYRLNQQGNFVVYSSPISISADTIVETYSELNGNSSDVIIKNCIYDDGIEEPVIECDGKYIMISCETPGSDIYYKLNQSGNYESYLSEIPITADTFVESYSEIDGRRSETVSADCIYDSTVSEPVIDCDGQEITMSCETLNANIYYKLDDESGFTQYESAITITADTLVTAFAELNGYSSTTVTGNCIYIPPVHDYSKDYLTFAVVSGGTIEYHMVGSNISKEIQYSVNNGEWTSMTASTTQQTISVQANDVVRFKGTNTTYAKDKNNHCVFSSGGTAYFNIEGNIMSLVNGDNFVDTSALTGTYNFCSLFKTAKVISAENLVLPTISLTNYCYRALFSLSSTLQIAPNLPATTLAKGCYWYMFEACPIEKAPELPATTLVAECYGNMFINCSNLNYIKCMASSNLSATSALTNWVKSVSSSGTFVKDGNTTWPSGINGIPNGWIVYNDELLLDPEITCDGTLVEITCGTSGSSINYRLNQEGNYGLYSVPIEISANTIVDAYSEYGGQSSNVVTELCEYVPHFYKFNGLEISQGPLYYGNNGYEIKDSWNYDSYNSVYGKTTGSTYFNLVEMGALFENSGFTIYDGNVDNGLMPMGGWRLPTSSEWSSIIGTTRSGSTVNNTANKHYAFIELTGVTYAGSSTVLGILLFPDDETITGVSLSYMDVSSVNNGITEAQLNNYLSQGCVFLPAGGSYNTNTWENANINGKYLSSTEYDASNSYVLTFDSNNMSVSNDSKTYLYNTVRLVRDTSYGEETPLGASVKNVSAWRYNNQDIVVPYSINAINGHSQTYSKGTFNFETTIKLYKQQPTYLWFQHADQTADIYVDDVKVETHWGGYNAFFSDITNHVHEGTNSIKVALCNTTRNEIAPAAGDFNFNATLGYVKVLTSPVLPSMNYGYDGFHVTSVVDTAATLTIKTTIPVGAEVICKIDDELYHFNEKKESTGNELVFTATVQNPHLWNGTLDPHLYTITLEIYHNGDLYHRYQRPYGIRYYDYVFNNTSVLPNNEPYTGFLLNGSPYLLRGVCMHSDLEGKANALTTADIANDFAVIQDLGCNFLRLAHYPHPKEVYDWCDYLGIIVQTEAPCVNKFQSTMPEDYYTHLNTQYEEMVNQHYNHPCIIFWGLSNETTTDDKAFAKTKIEGYNTLIKSLDPYRLVGYVMSHNFDDPSGYYNNPDLDWFGANIYVGWYIDQTSNNPTSKLNTRITKTITSIQKPLAFSEYGAGGTQNCHSDDFMTTTTPGNHERHDIEYQMWLHEGHVAAIRNFPQLIFTAEWQLFDVAVSSRNEGYTICPDGENASIDENLRRLNNKGLVERDHFTRKDTFYLYKAEWSAQKFVHICGKDYTKRTNREIKCYTNEGNLSIYVNNVFIESAEVSNNIVTFNERTFLPGDTIKVSGTTTYDEFTIFGEFIDLGLPSGTLWGPENLKDENGNELYFAWGETSGYTSGQVGSDKYFYNDFRDYQFGNPPSKYNTTDGLTTLEDVDNAVISYLGSGFTIPTKNQFEELLNNTTQTWDSINSGIVFTSIINGKTLFLPAAGCGINGQQQHTGSSGFYWSSTLGTDNKSCAYRFYIPINEYSIYESVRSSGWSIRPVVTPNI